MPGRRDEDLDEDVEDAATVQMGETELKELMKGLATPEPAARGRPAAAGAEPPRPAPRPEPARPQARGDDRPSRLPEDQRVRVGEAGQRREEPNRSPLLVILPVLVLLMLALAGIYAFTQLG